MHTLQQSWSWWSGLFILDWIPRNDDNARGRGRGQNHAEGTESNSGGAQKGQVHVHAILLTLQTPLKSK